MFNSLTRHRTIALLAEIAEIEAQTLRGSERLREDLGLDSIGSLELLATIASELKLDLEVEDAMEIHTVEDACVFIDRQYRAQHPELYACNA